MNKPQPYLPWVHFGIARKQLLTAGELQRMRQKSSLTSGWHLNLATSRSDNLMYSHVVQPRLQHTNICIKCSSFQRKPVRVPKKACNDFLPIS